MRSRTSRPRSICRRRQGARRARRGRRAQAVDHGRAVPHGRAHRQEDRARARWRRRWRRAPTKKMATVLDDRLRSSRCSACSCSLMPLVLAKKYPGQGSVLFKYSALAAVTFFVTVNLFGGVLYRHAHRAGRARRATRTRASRSRRARSTRSTTTPRTTSRWARSCSCRRSSRCATTPTSSPRCCCSRTARRSSRTRRCSCQHREDVQEGRLHLQDPADHPDPRDADPVRARDQADADRDHQAADARAAGRGRASAREVVTKSHAAREGRAARDAVHDRRAHRADAGVGVRARPDRRARARRAAPLLQPRRHLPPVRRGRVDAASCSSRCSA